MGRPFLERLAKARVGRGPGKVTVDPLARVAAKSTYTVLTAGTVSGTFATATS